MTLVFMFPGQSSRYPTMIQKLVELHQPNREILAAASDFLRRNLLQHYKETNTDQFNRNQDVQIGVFLANHMFLRILEDAGITADLSLGLSLGEYNHLVHIGALGFKEALLTVEQRGKAYDAGPRGAMASVFPIDLDQLQEVVDQTSSLGVLEIVNLNSPSQHVISGDTAALDEALRILEAETYAQTVVIERQVPMHCSTFAPVGESFRRTLEGVSFAKPRRPYLPNRLGSMVENPDSSTFIDLLSTHVHSPVLWRQSIDLVVEKWPEAVFVEVGPLAVLHNLMSKKWHKNKKFCTDSAKDTAEHVRQITDEIKAL